MKNEAEKKFPGAASFAIGGFVFLRFLSPAIATPDAKAALCETSGELLLSEMQNMFSE
jgi:hypothetical protein